MTLYLLEDRFHYELENIMRMFYWRPEISSGAPDENADEYCAAAAADEGGSVRLSVRFR